MIGAYTNGSDYVQYAYDSQNKRIFSSPYASGSQGPQHVFFYGVDGQQLGAYPLSSGASALEIATYFGSKRLGFNTNPSNGSETATAPDRLGSYGSYYPWGESKSGNNPADIWSYATYWRDSFTGLDYANQRYYSNVPGRFMTPDPYTAKNGGAGDPADPQGWNRYVYATGDPANRLDPRGLLGCAVDDASCNPFEGDPDDDEDDDGAPSMLCQTLVYAYQGISSMWIPACESSPVIPVAQKPCPPNYQAWIAAHGGNAATVAGQMGIGGTTGEADILALSAYESGWGTGYFVQPQGNYTGNAYFNLERIATPNNPSPALFPYSTGWKPARGNGNVLVAQYSSYLGSAESFAAVYGDLFSGNSSPLAFGTIAHSNGFGISPATFAQIANIFINCLSAGN
jgi:RHS repeat-associated protein